MKFFIVLAALNFMGLMFEVSARKEAQALGSAFFLIGCLIKAYAEHTGE